MKYWTALITWWWSVTEDHKWTRDPTTWVGHGLVAALIALPFALLGHGSHGFTAGVIAYAFRELCQVLGSGWHGWDHIGDVVGPVIGAGLIWWLI